MKKLLSILLVLAMVVSMVALSACESDPEGTGSNTSNTSVSVIPGTDDDGKDPDEDEEQTAIDFEVKPGNIPEGTVIEEFPAGEFTYDDYVSVLATNWNIHTYQSTDDAYPQDFLMVGLYTFIYNDALHPVEGREEYQGYKIIPEMAADGAVDVTEQIKADN